MVSDTAEGRQHVRWVINDLKVYETGELSHTPQAADVRAACKELVNSLKRPMGKKGPYWDRAVDLLARAMHTAEAHGRPDQATFLKEMGWSIYQAEYTGPSYLRWERSSSLKRE